MEVTDPRTKERVVKNPRTPSPVPYETRKKIMAEKTTTKIAQTEYSARRKDSAPS